MAQWIIYQPGTRKEKWYMPFPGHCLIQDFAIFCETFIVSLPFCLHKFWICNAKIVHEKLLSWGTIVEMRNWTENQLHLQYIRWSISHTFDPLIPKILYQFKTSFQFVFFFHLQSKVFKNFEVISKKENSKTFIQSYNLFEIYSFSGEFSKCYLFIASKHW